VVAAATTRTASAGSVEFSLVGGCSYVRDVGVAGSNPVTPTNILSRINDLGRVWLCPRTAGDKSVPTKARQRPSYKRARLFVTPELKESVLATLINRSRYTVTVPR